MFKLETDMECHLRFIGGNVRITVGLSLFLLFPDFCCKYWDNYEFNKVDIVDLFAISTKAMSTTNLVCISYR